jgi:hypothetical protein
VKRLELGLWDGPATRAPADALVVPLPEDERPLRGDAGRVDWRLSGQLSRLLLDGFASGRRGEAVLIPGDARVQARRVLLTGVGPAAELPGRTLERALRAAFTRVLALRAASAALALPEAVDPAVDAEDALRGIGFALASAEGRNALYVVIPDAAHYGRAWEGAAKALERELRERGVVATCHRIES